MAQTDTYEITVRGRLSPVLIEAAQMDSASYAEGFTIFIANNCDQGRLHSLFALLRDLNIPLVSVNTLDSSTRRG